MRGHNNNHNHNHNELCGRQPQYAPPLWPFDLESSVRVTCDVGYLCANFSLPRPLCSRLRPDVRDRQMPDAHHRLMPPPRGRGHNNRIYVAPCGRWSAMGVFPVNRGDRLAESVIMIVIFVIVIINSIAQITKAIAVRKLPQRHLVTVYSCVSP